MIASSEDLANALIGKTIAKVHHCPYLSWPMTVEKLEFTDGSVLELTGASDSACIVELSFHDGTFIIPKGSLNV